MVAGAYTLAVTNGANGCNFGTWRVGDTASGIGLTVTQTGNNVSAQLGGLVGAFSVAIIGTDTLTGTVSAQEILLMAHGTRQQVSGSCTYTLNALAVAHLSGDLLNGTIDYTTATDGSAACAALTNCHSTQSFNGTRPPTR
jgi:hypothetical protein